MFFLEEEKSSEENKRISSYYEEDIEVYNEIIFEALIDEFQKEEFEKEYQKYNNNNLELNPDSQK